MQLRVTVHGLLANCMICELFSKADQSQLKVTQERRENIPRQQQHVTMDIKAPA